MVTGISTGALIAPFAFLGSDYDDELAYLYNNVSPDMILERRGTLALLSSDSAADSQPLKDLVAKTIDRKFLDAIAAEYEKGRLLLIGTADLDARQGVIWNMTKIAATRDSRALDLFHSIMVASASIPGAFPPVMVDVEVHGQHYQEMHVDGGTVAQVFAYPPNLKVAEEMREALHLDRERAVYIIRNSRLEPEWCSTERKIMSIAGRAIASLTASQGVGDLYLIYATLNRDGVDFNVTFIPSNFSEPHAEEFDTKYMRALYQVGYDRAAHGNPWAKVPPGFLE